MYILCLFTDMTPCHAGNMDVVVCLWLLYYRPIPLRLGWVCFVLQPYPDSAYKPCPLMVGCISKAQYILIVEEEVIAGPTMKDLLQAVFHNCFTQALPDTCRGLYMHNMSMTSYKNMLGDVHATCFLFSLFTSPGHFGSIKAQPPVCTEQSTSPCSHLS